MNDTPVHVLKIKRSGDVLFDGDPIGTVARTPSRLYAARRPDGSVVTDRADCKATAMSRLAGDAGLLPTGSRYRIEGLPSATGGPWTVALAPAQQHALRRAEGRVTPAQLEAATAVVFKDEWEGPSGATHGPVWLRVPTSESSDELVPVRLGDAAEWHPDTFAENLAAAIGAEVEWV